MDNLSKNIFFSQKIQRIGVDFSANEEFFDGNFPKKPNLVDNVKNWPKNPDFGYLTHEMIGFLVGAANDSLINSKKLSDFSYQITCTNQKYEIFMSIIVNFAKKDIFINNFSIKRENCGLGLGSRVFFRQWFTSKKIGIKKIYGYAAGSPDDKTNNGYYTMARFGCDGYLTKKIINKANYDLGIKNPRTVQEIFDEKNGDKWWKQNGKGFDFWFCLSDNSRNVEKFLNYAKNKNIMV